MSANVWNINGFVLQPWQGYSLIAVALVTIFFAILIIRDLWNL